MAQTYRTRGYSRVVGPRPQVVQFTEAFRVRAIRLVFHARLQIGLVIGSHKFGVVVSLVLAVARTAIVICYRTRKYCTSILMLLTIVTEHYVKYSRPQSFDLWTRKSR